MSKKPRLKVLILAYSISPVRGSEYSVGWNHVQQLSKHCDLTVLYGLAGPHMGDFEEIENYLRDNDAMPNVRFVPIKPNFLAQIANAPNRKGILVYSFYMAYWIWHAQAARRARKIVAAEEIDLIHYLCPIGYREPGFLWKINKPYIWGPVGGMLPTRHLKGAPRPWKATIKTTIKNLLNAMQLASTQRATHALARADIVVAATTENREVMRHRFNIEARHIPENAIPDEWLSTVSIAKKTSGKNKVNLIWIGSLDYRKSPDLLIDAMSRVNSGNWQLHIVGEGSLATTLKALAFDKGIASKLTFHGLLPRHQVQDLLARSHLHLITSLGEANTTVIWEAMAAGVPTLTLDHCGMHDIVCDRCGVRVKLTSYDETCNNIATEIDTLLQNRGALSNLAKGVLGCREQHLWSRRTKEWLKVYHQAITRRHHH